MKPRIVSACIGIALLIGLSWLFYFKDYMADRKNNQYRPIPEHQTKQVNSISYDAEKEIAAASARLQLSKNMATVVSGSLGKEKNITLTFDGMGTAYVMNKTVELLQKHELKAIFFFEGMQVAEEPQIVQTIKRSGFPVENYSLHGTTQLEDLTTEKLIFDFCQSKKIFRIAADTDSKILKCNETKYTEQVRQAAMACAFQFLVKSDVLVTAQTVKILDSEQAANEYVKKIKPGSIVSVKLKSRKEPQSGGKMLPQPLDKTDTEQVAVIDRLLQAIKKNGFRTIALPENLEKKTGISNQLQQESTWRTRYLPLIQALIDKVLFSPVYAAPDDEIRIDTQSKELRYINTIEQALTLSFSGISDPNPVRLVLSKLKNMGVKATFFISEIEMRTSKSLVKEIIAEGHEVGLAIRPREGASIEQTRNQINVGRTKLKELFGIETELVKQPLSAIENNTLLAVQAEKAILIGQTITMVQAKHKDATDAKKVIEELFPPSIKALGRGYITHFRLDYYSHPKLAAEMTEELKRQKIDNITYSTDFDNPQTNSGNDSAYKIKPVGEILKNKKFRYRYPVETKSATSPIRSEEQTCASRQQSFLEKVNKCYIGNPAVTEEDRLHNFSRMEARRIDLSGLIRTNKPIIFLTFDDWGTDEPVNKLLYVLRKHNVPATFFIITGSVLNNPNLLRAIAAEGHDIGSHTERHVPMVQRDPESGKSIGFQYSKDEYADELKLSNDKLYKIVGDVERNGRPVLTKYFRPPQLAVTRKGMEAIFEAGYEYVVSGSYTTQDYYAEDADTLLRAIMQGIYNSKREVIKGSIVVMHMSDNSMYTAVALDILLTANAKKADSDPTKFIVGRLSDYLTGGYIQKASIKKY